MSIIQFSGKPVEDTLKPHFRVTLTPLSDKARETLPETQTIDSAGAIVINMNSGRFSIAVMGDMALAEAVAAFMSFKPFYECTKLLMALPKEAWLPDEDEE